MKNVKGLFGAVLLLFLCYGYAIGITKTPTPVQAVPEISDITVKPASIFSGNQADATVTLSAPAPDTGVSINITSSSPVATLSFASISTVITVPKGQSQASFKVQTTTVLGSSVSANITATLNGKSRQASITILPPLALSSLTLSPTSGGQGSTITGSVTTNFPVISNTSVILQRVPRISGDADVDLTFPSSLTIPAGKNSVTFTISIGTVVSAGSVEIRASLGLLTQAAALQVTR